MQALFVSLSRRFWFIAPLLLIAGCAHQPSTMAFDPPGFFLGFLHGFLIFFSFIGSLFTDRSGPVCLNSKPRYIRGT